MKIRYTTDGLDIRHTPGCIWIVSVFFSGIGSILLYGLLGGFSIYADVKSWEIAVGLIISISIISVGIWQVLSNPATLTKINGLEKTITQIEKGFFRRNITQYKFADVIKFEIIEEKDSEGDSFYYLVFRTTKGEKVKISSTGIQVKEYVSEIKDEVNKYLEREKLLDK